MHRLNPHLTGAPVPGVLQTRLDRLWTEFQSERSKAESGDREAADRAARLLGLYFAEFEPPRQRWPRHESGRLLMPREIAARGGLRQ